MAPDNEPEINFFARTWQEIKDEGIGLIKDRFPSYTDTAASDFGVMIVEVLAKFKRMINYRINFLANESFLSTATQRKSLLKYADQLSYTPKLPAAASVDLTFTKSNAEDSSIIPEGTIVTTPGGEVSYITVGQRQMFPGNNSCVVSAINANLHEGEFLGYSNGTNFQEFTLENSPLVERSDNRTVGLKVYVDGNRWGITSGIKTHLPSEKVCELAVDEDDVAHLIFGDNRSGKRPPEGAEITADYYTGGGREGLVGPNTLQNIAGSEGPGSVENVDSVTNQKQATGGRDRLTNEELRDSIRAQAQTLKRVVTKQDYRELIPADIPEVSKIDVEHPKDNLVDVYIAPSGGAPPSEDLLAQVQNYLDSHAIETDQPIVRAPDVIDVDVDVSVVVQEGYDPQDFMIELKSDLREYIDRWEFTDEIYINDIYAWMEKRVEIKEGTVLKLAEHGESGASNLETGTGEVFAAGDITISVSKE